MGVGKGRLPVSLARTYYIRSFASLCIESRPPRRFILPAKFLLRPPPEGGAMNLYWSLGEPI